jgi:hypothetical protein
LIHYYLQQLHQRYLVVGLQEVYFQRLQVQLKTYLVANLIHLHHQNLQFLTDLDDHHLSM